MFIETFPSSEIEKTFFLLLDVDSVTDKEHPSESSD